MPPGIQPTRGGVSIQQVKAEVAVFTAADFGIEDYDGLEIGLVSHWGTPKWHFFRKHGRMMMNQY
jgi:hypothetical protein